MRELSKHYLSTQNKYPSFQKKMCTQNKLKVGSCKTNRIVKGSTF